MRIQSIVRAGMLCALYGVVLFMNTVSGLWVENFFPYLFALPILVVSVLNEPDSKVPFCALCAMALLTLMLSSLTTWLLAGSMLLAGYIFGRGMRKKMNFLLLGMLAFVVLLIVNMLSMTLLAAVFGFNATEELAQFSMFSHMVSPFMILLMIGIFLSLLETIACALMAIVILPRSLHISMPLSLEVSPLVLWCLFPLIALWIFLASSNNPDLVVWRDLVLGLLMIDVVLLDWQGYLVRFRQLVRSPGKEGEAEEALVKKRKRRIFVLTFMALMPGLNLYPAALGAINLFQKTFRKKADSRLQT